MPAWKALTARLERFVLWHPILTVFILLLASTAIAALLPFGDPNVGATIWLVTGGAAMIWRWTVLKPKHAADPAPPGLTARLAAWWRGLGGSRKPGDTGQGRPPTG